MISEIQLPPDLEEAVRAQAAYAPAVTLDRAAVYRRARKIRRRAATVRAVAAGVVVLALGASYPLLRARLTPEVTSGGLVGDQPIPLWSDLEPRPATDGGVQAQLRTVNGRNVMVSVRDPQPGLTPGNSFGPAPVDGGGLATIGFAPATTSGTVGPQTVVVVDAAGRTVVSRPISHPGQATTRRMPMTGNATALFWWAFRGEGEPGQRTARPVLNRYELRDGRLSVLTPAVGVDGFDLPYFGMQATATRILSWPAVGGQTCSADIEDAGTGERVGVLRPVVKNCDDVYFALSPDNQRVAALVTSRTASTWTQRVLVLDAHTGRVLKEVPTPGLAPGTERRKVVSGLDWAGNTKIRYARADLAGGDPILLQIRP